MEPYVLILTVGLPRSGKSTWARELSQLQAIPIVSPDAIRLALHGQPYVEVAEPMVWAICRVMISALFMAGHTRIILDACNVSAERRAEWDGNGPWEVRYKVFDADEVTCIERAMNGGRKDLVPVIKRMAAKWDPPTDNLI